MTKKTLSEIKLKSGATIPAGTELTLTLDARGIITEFGGSRIRLSYQKAKARFGAPFTAIPTLRTMEKWSDDGVARTVTGARIEPDGIGADGAPSWLLVVGLI